MELTEAISILKRLADGVDPETGEVFPEDSPYQRANTTRALYAALQRLELSTLNGKTRVLPDNAGKPWDLKEDEQAVREFERAIDFAEMARLHGRTRGAIVARLEKLGKLKPRSG